MLYFIPAWYQQGSFCEVEQYWYKRRLHSEFDDTVKQVQLFHRSGAYPYRIMLLSFAPNFRHFLHRQSVFHAPYWSCFDAIQEIHRKRAAILSYHNLEWPEGIEFTYSMFSMTALLNGHKYAQIEFGEDGNMIEIDMFENNKLHRRNIYDDRGFVASTILYDADEKPIYQDYLNEKAVWKIRYYFANGHVKVNEKSPSYLIDYEGAEETFAFAQSEYGSMAEIIAEVLGKYLEYTDADDIFCAACHSAHAQIVSEAFAKRKLILSFFENRYVPDRESEVLRVFSVADHFIVDSEINRDRIARVSEKYLPIITDITPYDSRVDFGISQQLEVQNILVPVDGLDESVTITLIEKLNSYIKTNKNARVHIFTRTADDNFVKRLYELINEYTDCEDASSDEANSENDIDSFGESKKEQLFFVGQCVSELAVSKCMKEQRIIVDVREVPELFLQISAISGGIPQIVIAGNQYVSHGQNGHVLGSLEELPTALEYYLANLNNWNEAKIYCYELGKKYTTKVLLGRWSEVIKSLGEN